MLVMGNKFKVDWRSADWRKQDVVLAAEFGCTREAARQARNDPRFGNGVKPDSFRKRTVVTATELLQAITTSEHTIPALARLTKSGEANIRVILKKLGKTFRKRPKGNAKYDWTRLPADWATRTDRALAAIVGASSPAVVAQWRIRHGCRKRARPIERHPAMASPYSPSSGYHRIFQRLVTDPPATKAELIEFAVTQMGKARTAAEASVQVVLSPRESGRNPRGNRSAKGHLYYVTEDAQGRWQAHPRVVPL